jgi:hypothetical protein
LVGEIFKWELATALACVPMRTNCFKAANGLGNLAKVSDQLEAIAANRDTFGGGGERLRESGICLYAEGQTRRAISSLSLRDALRTFFELRGADSYIAICPFFAMPQVYLRELWLMWDRVRGTLLMPVQASSGPRYLYAQGPIYKEGPPNGIFIIITSRPDQDTAIPGAGYTFGELQLALSLTEFETLERRQRPVIRLHLAEGPEKGLKQLSDIVIQALAQIRRYG